MSADRLNTTGPLLLEAPAKINLSLLVTGRRPDGYHLLDSVIVFAGTHDRIAIRSHDALTLEIAGPFGRGLEAGEDNLVMRAARALAAQAGVTAGAALTLEKNLPVSSGIGGGSADAAAALIGLNRLWDCGLDDQALRALGLTLGADVPVCLFGHPARVRGIGEDIEPLPFGPAAGLLLVNPGIAVSTPEVFGRRIGAFSAETAPPGSGVNSPQTLAAWLSGLNNDLEAPAKTVCPVISHVLGALSGAEGCHLARLSGSGATCFGIFDDLAAADNAAPGIAAQNRSWWVSATEIRS